MARKRDLTQTYNIGSQNIESTYYQFQCDYESDSLIRLSVLLFIAQTRRNQRRSSLSVPDLQVYQLLTSWKKLDTR